MQAALRGRLAPEKNLDTILRAYFAMRANVPGVKLVLVGDGPERAALQAQCREAVFAGPQSGTALAEHFASGDIFLFPSTTETFGNVTVEAMASGLPVIASTMPLQPNSSATAKTACSRSEIGRAHV